MLTARLRMKRWTLPRWGRPCAALALVWGGTHACPAWAQSYSPPAVQPPSSAPPATYSPPAAPYPYPPAQALSPQPAPAQTPNPPTPIVQGYYPSQAPSPQQQVSYPPLGPSSGVSPPGPYTLPQGTPVEGSVTPSPQPAGPSGLELGARLGYSIGLGSLTGAQNDSLSNTVSGRLPFGLDVGYRISPAFYVGGSFQYAPLFVASNGTTGCGQGGVSCSGHDLQLGIQAAYHPVQAGALDPWVGLGVGYEMANVDITRGSTSASAQVTGFQFLNLTAGADYKLDSKFGIGPLVSLSLGEYSNQEVCAAGGECVSKSISNSALHEWLTFGVRGAYDFKL